MKSRLVVLVVVLTLCTGVGTAAQRGQGPTGDWDMKLDFDGGEMTSILTITKDTEGKLTANGKRAGGPLVGKWDLAIDSDRGTRKQRLTVLPDLSGRFGAMPIKKIDLEEGLVDFELILPYGDNEYKISFTGELKARKLTGKMTTAQGTSDVTGTKIKPIRRKKK